MTAIVSRAEMESKDEGLRWRMAIRCAKASILLSSLKSSPNRHLNSSSKDDEKDVMMKEIRDLKMKLARERIKRKRMKVYEVMEVILQVMLLLLCFSTLLFVPVLLSLLVFDGPGASK